jgi:hypothetical protein
MIKNTTTGQQCLPIPFVSAKTADEASQKVPAKAATHVAEPARCVF